ncbi:ATP-dependent DNA helicase [Acetanaerobacterium elongatum]|uniref:DNA excision repair protein ERCC-2 n=1 Tax=Acetanaerobacterium elongatum TaxID=258515 RepID=A0A1H0GRI5_9FIRM|nr:ATP-dependent DNA helicase [Acetanaerobacterium elongatum]SDO09321.1 DNA excision repair protein ERCC-2 [Acetanaerobacterium elongatum]
MEEQQRNREVKISVRNLVEFLLRSGDLDSRFTGRDRMSEGAQLHRKLQKAYGSSYKAEVALKETRTVGGIAFTVIGRADGIITEEDKTTVDEIKSVTQPLDEVDEDFAPVHWAQARCYACMVAAQNGLTEITVRLTYVHADTEEVKTLDRVYTQEELETFFNDLLLSYHSWAEFSASWAELRDMSIKALSFPFAYYRRGQRELAAGVYKALRDEKRLFAQAPTGIGKTMSTVFPAVKAMGEGLTTKIFYLTAKTVTRQVAQEAFERLRENGLRFKTVTLTAKEKICFQDTPACTPETCPYAKGHYNRVNAALRELLEENDAITRETVEAYARKHTVCPFELSLDLSMWVDAVICDYNYAFDPRVYLKRFFAQENQIPDCVFLVDEAHNLVDRAREMFSAELKKSSFTQVKTALKKSAPRLKKRLNAVCKVFLELKEECGEERPSLVKNTQSEELCAALEHFLSECELWLKEHGKEHEQYDALLQLFFDSLGYLHTAELFDERYVFITDCAGHDVRARLFCVDPSMLLNNALNRARGAALFSATLTPLQYFKNILGGREEDYILKLSSPFDQRNMHLLLCGGISTKYRHRDESYGRIAEVIKAVIGGRAGNYMVFFPSYLYLQRVYDEFKALCPEVDTLIQQSGMTEPEREEFLLRFDAQNSETLVGFSVMGGVFSEGVDLKGDRLIGSIIVGVGLPQVSTEQDIIMNFFNQENGMGFEYAYMYPGMNKVLQAAGRVIRSEADRGVVVLIDERFAHNEYLRLFPGHWSGCLLVKSPTQIEKSVREFWNECVDTTNSETL